MLNEKKNHDEVSHLTHVRMALLKQMKKYIYNKRWEGFSGRQTLYTVDGNVN